MLDIVAPHQQQLALAVEIESLDEAQAQLPRPRPARNAPAQIDRDLDDLEDEHEGDEKGDARQNPRQHSVVLQKSRHGLSPSPDRRTLFGLDL